jgi:CheY-like chemotaxis protein
MEHPMDLSLLVVDDDRNLRRLLAREAAARGHAVWTACDGPNALLLAHAHKPSAILLDIAMPGIDGRDVLMRLKADPGTAPIPVFVLSGTTDPYTRELCLDYGADDFLEKPFEAGKVLDHLERALAAPVPPAP